LEVEVVKRLGGGRATDVREAEKIEENRHAAVRRIAPEPATRMLLPVSHCHHT
jgi:hypothetical protein